MKKTVLAAALIACSIGAFAQSNFTGLTAAANFNTTSSNLEATASGSTLSFGSSSQNVTLEAAYGIALSPSTVLNVGGTYLLGDQKLATLTSGSNTVEITGKNAYSLYVEPTAVLSADSAFYGKLAYLSIEGKTNVTSGTESFNGFGYGAGFRHFFDKNLFAQVEFTQSNYESKSSGGASLKPSVTSGSIGLGYKF
jgi:opacity protein-like surface antigen